MMDESLNVSPLWDMKDWAYMETVNKVSFMSSDFTLSDESGPPTKRLKHGMTRDKLIDILDIVQHASQALEMTETSSVKLLEKKKESGEKVEVEACCRMPSERDCESKTFNDGPFSRSKDKTDDSGYIGSPECMEEDINVQEVSKPSAETCMATTSDEESAKEVAENIGIRMLQRVSQKPDFRNLYELALKAIVPNNERLENGGFENFKGVRVILDNIYEKENEINDIIESLVKTKERAMRLSWSMQQTLDILRFWTLWDYHSCASMVNAKPFELQCGVILKRGRSLLQKLNLLKDVTHVDIAAWESFRKEVKHARDNITQLPSTSTFIYHDDDIQNVVFSVNKLWKRMYESNECRKVTDEKFSKLNKTIRSLFNLLSGTVSSTRPKYISDSPVRKQSVVGSKINLKSSNRI